jgi:tol-pal system-associated acyl-CoA thioesterase
VSKEFSLPVRVYIEDTDAGGIVYYVNYLKYMERARTEYMRSLGFGKQFIFSHELMFVVKKVQLDYRFPAELDDELAVSATLTQLGGASMVMGQSVHRSSELLASASIRIACVDRNTMKPARIPGEMAGVLRGQVLDQESTT